MRARHANIVDTMHQDNAGLPPEIADRFTEPFARFLKIEAAAGSTLLLAALAALILSNSAWSTPFLTFWETPIGLHFGSLDFTRSLRHWINDALMTLFFFVVALELKRELVLGELRNLRMGALGKTLLAIAIARNCIRGGALGRYLDLTLTESAALHEQQRL